MSAAKALQASDGGPIELQKRFNMPNRALVLLLAGWFCAAAVAGAVEPPPAVAPFDAADARRHQAVWAEHLGSAVETRGALGMRLILIPPGEFLMGSTDEQVEAALADPASPNISPRDQARTREGERPAHRVTITRPFRIGATEVTVGQFRQFVEATGYQTDAQRYGFGNAAGSVAGDEVTPAMRKWNWQSPGYELTDDSPAAQVSWNDAVALCNWLSDRESLPRSYQLHPKRGWLRLPDAAGYRLPTEAEWEWACRAGTTTAFSFADDADHAAFGWFLANARRRTREVAGKRANPFGLYDMHGNVREWCHDWYQVDYYRTSPGIDPSGPAEGETHVHRGGSWKSKPVFYRSARRDSSPPDYRSNSVGVRLVAPP